ncbi:hypothetical protein B0J14DRAFT_635086 [Halenospora varia]|nr:hypothetical protein B0J14DRAFT_635086 [Halenospora varia]
MAFTLFAMDIAPIWLGLGYHAADLNHDEIKQVLKFFNAEFNILTDIMIIAIPIPVISSLRLSLSLDPTYDIANVSIWSAIEVNMHNLLLIPNHSTRSVPPIPEVLRSQLKHIRSIHPSSSQAVATRRQSPDKSYYSCWGCATAISKQR